MVCDSISRIGRKEVTQMMDTLHRSEEYMSNLDMRLSIEAVDLGDLDALEEDIVPCTGCGCSQCC